jgi:hypothetical protein
MDNRLHTQGPLHAHHNQGGTEMFESKAEMMKTIGNGANYVEFSCSREDVKGMLIMPKPTPTRSIVAPKYHPGYGYPNAYQ